MVPSEWFGCGARTYRARKARAPKGKGWRWSSLRAGGTTGKGAGWCLAGSSSNEAGKGQCGGIGRMTPWVGITRQKGCP